MLSHEEAQELHRIIGWPIETRQGDQQEYGTIPMKDLERARELAALIVSDTDPDNAAPDTSISVYLTGDADGPDLFGVIYDEEDGAAEAAFENDLYAWKVPAQLYGDRAVRIERDDDDAFEGDSDE